MLAFWGGLNRRVRLVSFRLNLHGWTMGTDSLVGLGKGPGTWKPQALTPNPKPNLKTQNPKPTTQNP